MNERAKHYFTRDSFYAHADKLYSSFQNNHSNAKKANAERFCWDYWHVENQYTQLRTPAKEYYYEGEILNEFYAKFEEELLKYARENLALSNFTPIWMSCYVDGMGQELHADVPHGPLAFVFSLTKNFDDSDDDKDEDDDVTGGAVRRGARRTEREDEQSGALLVLVFSHRKDRGDARGRTTNDDDGISCSVIRPTRR